MLFLLYGHNVMLQLSDRPQLLLIHTLEHSQLLLLLALSLGEHGLHLNLSAEATIINTVTNFATNWGISPNWPTMALSWYYKLTNGSITLHYKPTTGRILSSYKLTVGSITLYHKPTTGIITLYYKPTTGRGRQHHILCIFELADTLGEYLFLCLPCCLALRVLCRFVLLCPELIAATHGQSTPTPNSFVFILLPQLICFHFTPVLSNQRENPAIACFFVMLTIIKVLSTATTCTHRPPSTPPSTTRPSARALHVHR